MANGGVVDLILSFASFKANKELKKGDGAKRQRLTGGWCWGNGGRVRCQVGAEGANGAEAGLPALQAAAAAPQRPLLCPALLGYATVGVSSLLLTSPPAAARPSMPAIPGIPKLEDANDAGGRNSEHCTLILTEGDSAKSLAVAGLSVVGRDRFGVFPLRWALGSGWLEVVGAGRRRQG